MLLFHSKLFAKKKCFSSFLDAPRAWSACWVFWHGNKSSVVKKIEQMLPPPSLLWSITEQPINTLKALISPAVKKPV